MKPVQYLIVQIASCIPWENIWERPCYHKCQEKVRFSIVRLTVHDGNYPSLIETQFSDSALDLQATDNQ